jgi:ribose transport system substrate-binding protein
MDRSRRRLFGLACGALIALVASAAAVASGSAHQASPNLVFILGQKGDPYQMTMACGAEQEAKAKGVHLTVQGPTAFDPTLQIPIVNAVVATHPAAMLVLPTDPVALYVPLKQAQRAGIKIVLENTGLKNRDVAVTSIVSPDLQGGKMAADLLAKEVGYKGKVAVITFTAGQSLVTDGRWHGFEAEIKKLEKSHPGLKYLGPQFAAHNGTNAASVFSALYSKNPDLAGVLSTFTFATQALATGIRNNHVAGKVKVVGFDPDQASLNALKGGIVQILIAQQGIRQGQLGVDAALASLAGKSLPKFTQTGFTPFTKKTMNTPTVQKLLYKTTCKVG